MSSKSEALFYVYRNLRTGGFSVMHHGRVIQHLETGIALDVVFKVRPAGRARVLQTGQKQVHAFVACKHVSSADDLNTSGLDHISYNPYISGDFICNEKPITSAEAVGFSLGRCYLIK